MTEKTPDRSGADPGEHLPLSEAVYQILLSLTDEPLHGYAVIQDVATRGQAEVALRNRQFLADDGRLLAAIKARSEDVTADPEAVFESVLDDIEDDADLGVGCIVLPGVRIGRGAQIGAGVETARRGPVQRRETAVARNPGQPVAAEVAARGHETIELEVGERVAGSVQTGRDDVPGITTVTGDLHIPIICSHKNHVGIQWTRGNAGNGREIFSPCGINGKPPTFGLVLLGGIIRC